MMRAETIAILRRLSKGKSALSAIELVQFCRDAASASDQDIVTAVEKKVTAKKTASKPLWLIQMEESKKSLSWSSAAEAASKLVEIATDEGFIPVGFFDGRKRPPTFPAAAKAIAKIAGGDHLAAAYSREMVRLEKEFRLG